MLKVIITYPKNRKYLYIKGAHEKIFPDIFCSCIPTPGKNLAPPEEKSFPRACNFYNFGISYSTAPYSSTQQPLFLSGGIF